MSNFVTRVSKLIKGSLKSQRKLDRSSPVRRNARTRSLRRRVFESLEQRELLAIDFQILKDIAPGAASSTPSFITEMNGQLYFNANGGLWKTDGTNLGTVLVAPSTNPAELTNINGTLYFRGIDSTNGYELWKSDGTTLGTQVLKDILPGVSGSVPQNLTNISGTLFFKATASGVGEELWKSDGTAAGTTLIKDIRPGNFGSSVRYLTNVNGILFFAANDGVNALEPWRSDGTSAGTFMLKDIRPGAGFGSPRNYLNLGGTLYFGASDSNGEELWKSNGTTAGTVMVKDIWPGSNGSLPRYLTDVNGTLYVVVNDGVNGRELWKSDGTNAGTVLVKDTLPGAGSGSANFMTPVNGTVVMSATDGVNGFELWKTDGTAAGTVVLKEFQPGAAEGGPGSFSRVNDKVYFTANDGTHGPELWRTDGTLAGTEFVFDFTGDSSGASLSQVIAMGDYLFVVATTPAFGRELWVGSTVVTNEPPTNLEISANLIDENQPVGTTIGTFTTTDPNSSDTFTYSLVPGSGDEDNASFTIDSSGNLLSASSFDFESKATHSIRVRSTDQGGESYEKSLTISIRDLSEFAANPFYGMGLLVDINSNQNPFAFSNPSNSTQVGGFTYFSASSPTLGQELWRTDGTLGGTVLVKDINAGIGSSGASNLVNVGGTLFFTASNGVNGIELWKSDGTSAGTSLLKDIVPGIGNTQFANLTNIAGVLYFSANDLVNGAEVWRSDGTSAGTFLLKDIAPGAAGSSPTQFTSRNGEVMFAANDFVNGVELWKSDGTPSGTMMVRDIRSGAGSSQPTSLTNFGGTLYFTSNDTITGFELWKSDGTIAGTVQVADIAPGPASSAPTLLTVVGQTLFLRMNDGVRGQELWKTDGTTAGTVLVSDITVGSGSTSLSSFTNFNGSLYFVANDGVTGTELWKSDGTAAGTSLVAETAVGIAGNVSNLTNANGVIYFSASDGITGTEPWKSDGTAAGTQLLADVFPGVDASSPTNFVFANNTVFFRASSASGIRLWATDGTASGTRTLTDANSRTQSSDAAQLTNVNGTMYFAASDGATGLELWRTDGTAAGTMMVADIRPGSIGSNPTNLTNVNGVLYFSAHDGVNGYELWKSDGTAAGTVQVKDINPGATASNPTWFNNVNGMLYFVANDGVTGNELWKSDGTSAGTSLVKDIRPGSASSSPAYFANVNGVLYFTANDGTFGEEVWRTDGTDVGTQLLKDINPGAGSSLPRDLININGTLHFGINGGTNMLGQWKSDGTTAGTIKFKDMLGSGQELFYANGKIFMRTRDADHGFELWVSDGTDAGTVLVKDINPGTQSSYPVNFTNVNGTIYFSVNMPNNRSEFWKTDGTPEGTQLVKDGFVGTTTAAISTFQFADGALYFRANDGIHGEELWKSDGTTAGTVLAYDFTGDSGSSSHTALAISNKLFVVANTEQYGRELYVPAANQPPTSINLSGASIAEGLPVASLVGQLSTVDPNTLDTFTYSLVSGNGDSDNASFTIDGSQLKTNFVFDYENRSSFSIRVRSTDSGGLFIEQVINVIVTDVNEFPVSSPVDSDSQSNTITENAAIDSLVGITASAIDADGTNNSVSYSLINSDGGLFKIDPLTGVVRVASIGIDFEAAYEHSIVIRATGSDGSFADQAFTISVTNVVEGNDVEITGTNGNDQLDVWYTGVGTNSWIVKLNGTQVYSGLVPTGGKLVLHGVEGVDTLNVYGKSTSDTVAIEAGQVRVNGFTVTDSHIEQRIVRAEGGNDVLQYISGSVAMDGGNGQDRMEGPNESVAWTVSGLNSGTIKSLGVFSNVETLVGGNGDDDFQFLNGGSISAQVQGGGGTDQLNYAARVTAVTMNLQTKAATGTGGWLGIESIVGSAANADVLIGRNIANIWTISGADSGTYNSGEMMFAGIENLTGGSLIDTFAFSIAGAQISGFVRGLGGVDSIDYSGNTSAVQVNLATLSATGVGSFSTIESLIGGASTTDSLIGVDGANSWSITGANQGTVRSFAFNGFENLNGGSANDTFTLANSSASVSGLISGNEGGDTLVAASQANIWMIDNQNSGSLNGIAFQSVENLVGNNQVDLFQVLSAGQITGSVQGSSQGAGERDIISYSALNSSATIDLQSASGTGVSLFAGIEEFRGNASQNDSILGADASNNWSLTGINAGTVGSIRFVDFNNLVGGSSNDSFSLAAGGSVSGSINGSDGIDTIVGANSDTAWLILGSDAGQAGVSAFQNVENLVAGSGVDQFQFGPIGSLSGSINGGSGLDVIDASQVVSPLEIQITIPRSISGTLEAFTGVEQIVGGSDSNDTIVGPDINTTWQFNSAGQIVVGGVIFTEIEIARGGNSIDTFIGPNLQADWIVDGVGSGRITAGAATRRFESMENLTGGSSIDSLNVEPGGSITGTVNLGGGIDQIDLSQMLGALTVNTSSTVRSVMGVINSFTSVENVIGNEDANTQLVGSNAATSWTIDTTGKIVVSGVTFDGIPRLIAGTLADTLIGPNVDTLWTVDGIATGEVLIPSKTIRFVGVENLTGGTSGDSFEIKPTGQLPGNLNGGTGTGVNSLSYSSWLTNVSVNLSSASAGNVTSVIGIASNLAIVWGGDGNDTLIGNTTRSTTLIGGGGNDQLTGLNVRDILIGGLGADILVGQGGEDLLIAGRTLHDNNRNALIEIIAEWTNTTRNFNTRVANLAGTGTGPRLNGSTFLNIDSVFNDPESVDSLSGGSSQDWFFADLAEIVDFNGLGANPDRRS